MTNARVYFDVETTGFHPADSQIIEIAATLWKDDELVRGFSSLVYATPEAIERGASALAINHISPKDLETAPSVEKVAELVRNFLAPIIVEFPDVTYHSYNRQFDFTFLYQPPWSIEKERVGECVMEAATEAMGRSRWQKLSKAAEYFNVAWPGEAHRALADCIVAGHVHKEILRARKEALA